MKIGFVGQGYVGKNYADNFEKRGFKVVRYSIDGEYLDNREELKSCGVVFVAVPTPTRKSKSDSSIVASSLKLLAPDTIVVIKSTILPGTTKALQSKYKKLTVLHSPEFLTSKTASKDVEKPSRNILGIPSNSAKHKKAAKMVMKILPRAKFEMISTSRESEFIKYAVNTFYYSKVVYMNLLYDLAQKIGVKWENIKKSLAADPWTGPMHIEPVHKTGRGAGGHCLIKDYAAFKKFFGEKAPEAEGDLELLSIIEKRNIDLLTSTKKDLEVLKKVYGRDF